MNDEQLKYDPKRSAKLHAELKKLRRVDLLELLVDQVREGEKRAAAMAELERLVQDQKRQIDCKDEQIGNLIRHLDEKDAQIRRLQEQNDVYARSVDALNIRDLADFQENAIMEYLKRLSKDGE